MTKLLAIHHQSILGDVVLVFRRYERLLLGKCNAESHLPLAIIQHYLSSLSLLYGIVWHLRWSSVHSSLPITGYPKALGLHVSEQSVIACLAQAGQVYMGTISFHLDIGRGAISAQKCWCESCTICHSCSYTPLWQVSKSIYTIGLHDALHWHNSHFHLGSHSQIPPFS